MYTRLLFTTLLGCLQTLLAFKLVDFLEVVVFGLVNFFEEPCTTL